MLTFLSIQFSSIKHGHTMLKQASPLCPEGLMSQNQNSIPINSKSLWPVLQVLSFFLPSWYDIVGGIEFQDSEDLVNTSLSLSWLSLDTLSLFIENHLTLLP